MTPYDEIYRYFLRKLEAHDIREELEKDEELGKELLFDFLESAIPKFSYCNANLSDRNQELFRFNADLNDMEKEILSTLMVVEYLSPKLLNESFFADRLGSKDYQIFSPANKAKEIRALRSMYEDEAKSLQRDYYYRRGF